MLPFINLIIHSSQKNHSNDGEYTVFSGRQDIHDIGVIDKYNGSR